MDLSSWHGPSNRKTLVILGAGASYGASCVRSASEPRPPLDRGFFSELQKLPGNPVVSRLLTFVRQEFGLATGLSMEEFFSQAEYTDRFHDELNIDPGPKVHKYRRALSWFYESLILLFRQALDHQQCEYHARLARNLFVDDVVMSFNYDCLMDEALRDNADRRWDPEKEGYGFPLESGWTRWRTHKSRGRPFKSTIKLLKPHGSLNWNIADGRVRLDEKPYAAKTAADRIIPPTWFKDLAAEPFASVWKKARLAVRTARAIVVVGYSVPQTDLFSRALFKVEAGSKEKREKLDFLVLANPEPEARQRFVDLVHGGIESNTRILEFNSFHEMIYTLPDKRPPK